MCTKLSATSMIINTWLVMYLIILSKKELDKIIEEKNKKLCRVCLYELGVTSTYDDVKRFKISAAKHSSIEGQVLQSSKDLIQGSSDNFDTDLSHHYYSKY